VSRLPSVYLQEWSDAQKKHETIRNALFYTDAGAAQVYKDHVKFIVNRKNSINGRIYKEDPTILAWNLINEPRCETWVPENGDCNSRLDKWLSDMAEYVRSVDPNHLVTSGE
jgi:mannan endo-1,4-beta-mannosidase